MAFLPHIHDRNLEILGMHSSFLFTSDGFKALIKHGDSYGPSKVSEERIEKLVEERIEKLVEENYKIKYTCMIIGIKDIGVI